jgi:hypothetical protein
LGICPLINNCYGQDINGVPGTISNGDVIPGKVQISTPVAGDGDTWVLVNTTVPTICYTEETGKQMIIELENSKDYKDQNELYKQSLAELEKQIGLLKETNIEFENQIGLLKEINKLQQEQLNISKQTINSYKELIQSQKEAFEKQIENQKPSILNRIGTALGSLGIGVLVGILIL